jgi:hypothetical protein
MWQSPQIGKWKEIRKQAVKLERASDKVRQDERQSDEQFHARIAEGGALDIQEKESECGT